jgi:hypothetical protein
LHLFVRKGLDMTVIQPSLFILFERFPELKETIKALFKKNESFRTLCEDYRQCADTLQYWNQSLGEEALVRMREYETLLRELEEEILQNVNESA